jgi:hypothetical protein
MVIVDAQNVDLGLVLPHELRPEDAWIDGRAKNTRRVADWNTDILNALQ